MATRSEAPATWKLRAVRAATQTGRAVRRLRWQRLGVYLLVLVLVACLGWLRPPQARAATGIQVVINGISKPVDITTADYDVVPPRDYTLRGPTSAIPVTHTGVSVWRLIQLAGGAPSQVDELRVQRLDGSWVTLNAADIAGTSFPEGPALVWEDGGAFNFFRPVRNGTDQNAQDGIQASSLVFVAHAGPLLTVTATVDPQRTKVGEPVQFAASVTGQEVGETLGYSWVFDDGRKGSGASIVHRFGKAGTFQVIVTVTGDLGSGGSAEPVIVTVGSSSGPPGPGDGGHGHPGGGGTRPNGGTGSGSGAKTGSDSGNGTGSGAGSGGATPSSTGGRSGGGGTHTTQPRSGHSGAVGVPVQGVLVSSTTGGASGTGGSASTAFGPGGTRASGFPAGTATAIVVALMLLGLGGWAERRDSRRVWRRAA